MPASTLSAMTANPAPKAPAMAVKDLRLPTWVIVWLCVTAAIQTYDACYVLLGPLSHAGGPLAGFWPGHVFYGSFDHRYAQFDAFGSAQSWANLVEVIAIVWVLAGASMVWTRRGAARLGGDVLEDSHLLPRRSLERPGDDQTVARTR